MKKGIWAVVGVLVLVIGYVVAGPFLTIHQIKGALKERDKEALAERVDFPVLRTNLKEQFNERLMDEMSSSQHADGFAAFGMMLASKLVDVMVDAMVTPSGIARLMSGEKPVDRGSKGDSGEDAPAPRKEPLADASYSFKGVSKFVARVTNKEGEAIDFVLTRDGLSWQLTNIVLPES